MKKLLLLIALLSISFSYGQKCKYDIDKVDLFTKDTILETKTTRFGKIRTLNYVDAYARSINSNKYIGLYFHVAELFSVSKGDKVILLDDKGETVSLLINDYKVADSRYNSSLKMFFHSTQLIFLLNDEVNSFIKNKNVTHLRLESTKSNFDFEIKEKDLNNVRSIIKCIE